MARVRVGLVGCGFAAELHMYAYKRVYGLEAEVAAVAARGDRVVNFARKHRIRNTHRDFHALLADKEIDVIDICTPPALHAAMIVESMQAGKHVICEKPFAGYFGRGSDKPPIGKHVPKSLMYQRVMEEMDKTCVAMKSSGKLFMYAEDWIYAPAVAKTVEILNATKDKILFMKAEESHSGSHAAHAAQWSMTGGGSLIRMGCHPLSTALYLKQVEAKARGERIAVSHVSADVGNVAACLRPEERTFIKANPVDVEDWGMLTLTFSDGTKSTVFSGDVIMGGVRNSVEIYTSGGSLFANITPNNHMVSYLTDERKLDGVYITEKVDRKTGWQFICLEEEWTRGYLQEIQDFMECVSLGRQPLADAGLAYETMKVNYAAYWSAEEGRRIAL
ncbi:MAG TPA: Gfo/Idh/MocA family oxidoreductase [Stellaceae bacterium]